MTELEKDLKNICFDEEDIRTQIKIIESSMELFQREKDNSDILDDKHTDQLENLIDKENQSLQKMKDRYPEYFI